MRKFPLGTFRVTQDDPTLYIINRGFRIPYNCLNYSTSFIQSELKFYKRINDPLDQEIIQWLEIELRKRKFLQI
jgi:hypothetical protein